jgi:DNA-binding IclR family transcriptional regulator
MNSTRAQSKSGLTALDELRAEKVHAWHRERLAVVYVRQSTPSKFLTTRSPHGSNMGWSVEPKRWGGPLTVFW